MAAADDESMEDTLGETEQQRQAHRMERQQRELAEEALVLAKRKQPGIGFPSAGKQKHLLLIRLDVARSAPFNAQVVSNGLKRLCGLFARIDSGDKTIDVLSDAGGPRRASLVEDFSFTATVGFGLGFFDLIGTPAAKRPKKLREMPDHTGLGDVTPYCLGQTDILIQLGSTDDFINRWVLENTLQPVAPGAAPGGPEDIVSALSGWATVADVHAGFQRVDGRNLQGFNDGVSNPRRLSPLFDQVVWTTMDDEGDADLVDGSYLVFQKIVHDLDQWRALDVDEQQEWVGRSKGTGLLLGTLPRDEDAQLGQDLQSNDPAVRETALRRWKPLFNEQSNPEAQFFGHAGGDINGVPSYQVPDKTGTPQPSQVPARCPAWAHVRKANPREENEGALTPGYAIPQKRLIFRRGYPFMEYGLDGKARAGLLFVCFQRDLGERFEFIKQSWFNSGQFPTPSRRAFSDAETAARHRRGRLTQAELNGLSPEQRTLLGLADPNDFQNALAEAATQETGREGLAGPSELGTTLTGNFMATVTLGGGYYFVPPIPSQSIADIGQTFFPAVSP